MHLTKRAFLTRAAALAGSAALPTTVWSETRATVGSLDITTLSDGNLTLPPGFIFGAMPQEELPEVLAPYGIAPDATLTPPCNITLLRDGSRTVLFDAGAGFGFQASAGQLTDALASAGIAPGDVTHVVITHGHPDHIWGLLDDFDEPTFANAEHIMGEAEFAYWMDDATVTTIGEARASFAVGAKRRLEAIARDITLIRDGAAVIPGVTAQETPGHTPGHMIFRVSDGDESLLILGDAIGNHHVAFARPDWPLGADHDVQQGAATRRALFDQITAEDTRVIGFHFPQGGIGRVTPDGEGYRFLAGA